MTPGIPARLSARLLREFGSPDGAGDAAIPDREPMAPGSSTFSQSFYSTPR
jgi:hypothetical protein